MIPYPLLGQGAVRTVGLHLSRIPNCSEVPVPPPPQKPPPSSPPPPPPKGASGQLLVGGSWRLDPGSCTPVDHSFYGHKLSKT